MNDPQFVEASRVLAAKVLKERDGETERLERIYRLLTSRAPSDAELSSLKGMYDSVLKSFRESPERADEFLAIGEYPISDVEDRGELAAHGVIASMVMNHDAAVIKR